MLPAHSREAAEVGVARHQGATVLDRNCLIGAVGSLGYARE